MVGCHDGYDWSDRYDGPWNALAVANLSWKES